MCGGDGEILCVEMKRERFRDGENVVRSSATIIVCIIM